MKRPMRILVVDDSMVCRHGLTRLFSASEDFTVVDTAQNGEVALHKLAEQQIDAVLLDFEMPVMDGLTTLAQIRKLYKKMIVIMFSSHTAKGASITLEALMLGANDYVVKATTEEGHTISLEESFNELTTKLRALDTREFSSAAAAPAATVQSGVALVTKPRIIAIGSSTGGPVALERFLGALGGQVSIPIVIAQHMPPMFTKQLAGILTKRSTLTVVEGEMGMKLEPGHAYIAPGDFHMTIKKDGEQGVIEINQDAPENYCRPSVDVLYRSCAKAYGKFMIAVQLTGMGHDGMKGAAEVALSGGEVMAQDKTSSVVFSMPQSVIDQGIATLVLPPEQLAAEILTRLTNKLPRSA